MTAYFLFLTAIFILFCVGFVSIAIFSLGITVNVSDGGGMWMWRRPGIRWGMMGGGMVMMGGVVSRLWRVRFGIGIVVTSVLTVVFVAAFTGPCYAGCTAIFSHAVC